LALRLVWRGSIYEPLTTEKMTVEANKLSAWLLSCLREWNRLEIANKGAEEAEKWAYAKTKGFIPEDERKGASIHLLSFLMGKPSEFNKLWRLDNPKNKQLKSVHRQFFRKFWEKGYISDVRKNKSEELLFDVELETKQDTELAIKWLKDRGLNVYTNKTNTLRFIASFA